MILPTSIFSLVEHCGILISNTSVRLVGLSAKQVVKNKTEVTAAEQIFNGDEVNQPLLEKLLVELLEKSGMKPSYAAVCIPEKIAYSREYQLPLLTPPEVQEAISWQIGTIFPFPPEEIYFDWKLVEKTSDQTRVVVVAVTKKVIDGIQAVLKKVGIKAISFEPSASILSRAITSPDVSDYIVLEIDGFGTSATLIQHKVASITTTTHFQPQANPQEVIDGIVSSVANITHHTYKSGVSENFHIFITGEKASESLAKLFSEKLQLPVTLLPISQVDSSFHVPFLAAQSIILPPQSDRSINLLPREMQAMYQLEVETIQAKQAFWLGFVPAFISLLVAIGLAAATFVQLSLVKSQAVVPAAPANTLKDINIPLVLQKAQKVTRIQSINVVPADLIAKIFELQSESVIIKHVSVDMSKKTIQLTTEGENRAAFVGFKSALESSQLVTNVTIPLAALAADSKQDAVIIMKMK